MTERPLPRLRVAIALFLDEEAVAKNAEGNYTYTVRASTTTSDETIWTFKAADRDEALAMFAARLANGRHARKPRAG